MRIISFNANGIRSATSKGFADWFRDQDADLLCLQETKAQEHQLAGGPCIFDGYACLFHDARTRMGYSGVGIYTRRQPDEVRTRLGWAPFDDEGRYLEARFGQLSVVSLYLPSGSSGDVRQGFKFEVMAWLKPILDGWLASGRDYVLCGDWNIVRSRLDIRNWSSNQKNSGCLPEERAWLNALCADTREQAQPDTGRGWVDAYRVLHPDGQDYTWWSNRGAARANDVGWRIDYQLVTPGLGQRLRECAIAREPRFSDHAPFTVDYADAAGSVRAAAATSGAGKGAPGSSNRPASPGAGSTGGKPASAKPTSAKPASAKPSSPRSASSKSATAKPATAGPTRAKSTGAKRTGATPASTEPASARSASTKPTTGKGAGAKPAKPAGAKRTSGTPESHQTAAAKAASAKPGPEPASATSSGRAPVAGKTGSARTPAARRRRR